MHSFPKGQNLELIAWSDAAWANRPNGSDSTEGTFTGMGAAALGEGNEAAVTPIDWAVSTVSAGRQRVQKPTMGALDAEG